MSARRLRLLDAFCCAGGATRGYQQAGFHVVGVDIAEQPDYCGDEFVRADAVEYIAAFGSEFDAVHASPPCQDHIAITAGNRARPGWTDGHRNLIAPTRAALAEVRARTGVPTVIECGVGRHLRRDLMLCGDMFYAPGYDGPRVQRHRYFELDGFAVEQPEHPKPLGRVRGWRHGQYFDGPYVAVYGKGGGKASVAEARAAMGIDWTGDLEALNEAIPPAYTRHIGARLAAEVRRRELQP